MAIMATLESVNAIRTIRLRICLPALDGLGCHARSSFAASVLWGARKPTRLLAGRLHYSLPRHPKCPFQVRDRCVRAFLTLLPSTGVLASGRTLRRPDTHGQYVTLPIPTVRPELVDQFQAGHEGASHSARTAPQPRRGRL